MEGKQSNRGQVFRRKGNIAKAQETRCTNVFILIQLV